VCAALLKDAKYNFSLEAQDTLTSSLKQFFREAGAPLLEPYGAWLAVARQTKPQTVQRVTQLKVRYPNPLNHAWVAPWWNCQIAQCCNPIHSLTLPHHPHHHTP
jgi:hypothetical protein